MPELPIFPLPGTVVFPGMTVPLYIFEERYKRLVRLALELETPQFLMVLSREPDSLEDVSTPFYELGTLVQVVDSSENPDGTFNLLGHGQTRCQIAPKRREDIKEVDGSSRSLYLSDLDEFPLERSDPNLERVAAWDALDAFRSYARTFFAEDSLKQIEEIIPEDLVFQASFICANVRVPIHERQELLKAKSLSDRFGLAQKMMLERVAAHKPTDLKS